MIEMHCPNCREQLILDDGFRGGVARCFECSSLITVPSRAEETARPIRQAGTRTETSATQAMTQTAVFEADDGRTFELTDRDISAIPVARRRAARRPITRKRASPAPWIAMGAGGLVVLIILLAVISGGSRVQEAPEVSPEPSSAPPTVASTAPPRGPSHTLDDYRRALPDADDRFLMIQMNRGLSIEDAVEEWRRETARLGLSAPPEPPAATSSSVTTPTPVATQTPPTPAPATATATQPAILSFSLVEAPSGQKVLRPLKNGDRIDIASLGSVAIVADVSPNTGCVQFSLSGHKSRTENVAPFVVLGDNNGVFTAWLPAPGDHTISAIPYETSGGRGRKGDEFKIRVTVVHTGSAAASMTDRLKKDLMAHWEFEQPSGAQEAIDTTGQHPARLQTDHPDTAPSPLWQHAGPIGKSIRLSGREYLAASKTRFIEQMNEAFSISVWVKVEKWTRQWETLVARGNTRWRLHRYKETPFVSLSASGLIADPQQPATTELPSLSATSTTAISDGRWHHLAATFDGQAMRLYVDGRLEDKQSAHGKFNPHSNGVWIGNNSHWPNRHFSGGMDDLRLYARVLDEDEIQWLARPDTPAPETFVSPPASTLQTLDTGLLACWHLDESPGAMRYLDALGTHHGRPSDRSGITQIPGIHGSALRLSQGYIRVPTHSALYATRDAMTVAAWIRVNRWPELPSWTGIVTKGDRNWRLQRWQDTRGVGFFVTERTQLDLPEDAQGGTRVHFAAHNQPVDDGQWHHVAGSFDGKHLRYYLDGKLLAETPYSGTIHQTQSDIGLGSNSDFVKRQLPGDLDEVRLYDRALNAAEIRQLASIQLSSADSAVRPPK